MSYPTKTEAVKTETAKPEAEEPETELNESELASVAGGGIQYLTPLPPNVSFWGSGCAC